MASGRTHNRVTMALIVPAGFLAYQASGDALAMCAAMAGCAFSLLVDPDLDIDTGTRNKKRARRSFGPFAIPWLVFWHAYSLAVPHRSPVSHFPILGTMIRLAYLFGGSLFVAWLLSPDLAGWLWQQLCWPAGAYILWAAAGLALSDIAHWVFDGFPIRARRQK